MNQQWTALAAAAGVTLVAAQHDQLARYLDLLFAANQKMNLTRITDRSAAEWQHIADALTLLPFLPAGSHRIADVGSGGGVPGIPLAIARPNAGVLLIESTKKKTAFLAAAVAELGLSNVKTTDKRAEEVARTGARESFDVVASRAVATLDFLVEYCLPLAKVGGKMLAMKGPRVAEELPAAQRAIRLLGGGETQVCPVELAGADEHVIVEIIKQFKTPERFPRPPSQQKGQPIG
jgi:16S rRNA (guanine527-N7)-methyltransferase